MPKLGQSYFSFRHSLYCLNTETRIALCDKLIKNIDDRLPAIDGSSEVEILICPPHTLLFPIAKAVANSPGLPLSWAGRVRLT